MFEKLVFSQLFKTFSIIYTNEYSLVYSKYLAICPYLSHLNPVQSWHSILLKPILISTLRSSKSHPSIKVFYHNPVCDSFFPVRATSLANLILLYFITRVIMYDNTVT